MNLLRLLLALLRATLRPARSSLRADRLPAPVAPSPRIPRQARHRIGDQAAELLARDFPHWRIVVIPDQADAWFVAAMGGHLIRSTSAEETRRRIRQIENAPPLSPVRPYADRRP